MKIPQHTKEQRKNHLLLQQRRYHRSNKPWPHESCAGTDGRTSSLFIPHVYTDQPNGTLSWWADVGFLQSRRRVMVWWQHPRNVYNDRLMERAYNLVPEPECVRHPVQELVRPYVEITTDQGKISRRKVKKVLWPLEDPSEENQRYYDELFATNKRLIKTGVPDLTIAPSIKIEQLSWAVGIDLVAPIEVNCMTEVADLAHLARRLFLRETTLEQEFAGYSYGQKQWLQDQETIQKRRNENTHDQDD